MFLLKHEQRCEQQEVAAIKTSNYSHLCWRKYFPKTSLCFRVLADLEPDNEVDIFNIVIKTTKLYKQNPACNGQGMRVSAVF